MGKDRSSRLHLPIGICLLLNAAILLLILATSKGVAALPAAKSFRQIRSHRKDATVNIEKNDVADVDELFLEQPLDHFATDYKDKYPNASLHQRYFYTSRYVNQKNESYVPTYVFLCVGGEGPYLDKTVLLDSVHCTGDMLELAKILYVEHKASVHLFALEHRYYGLSYPEFPSDPSASDDVNSPVSTEHLVFLSSRQAQADLAHFVQTIIHTDANPSRNSLSSKITEHTKWITFGGSYPGMMSGYARMLYPHLIHAAVSSSVPLEITLDFTGYKEKVAWGLQYEKVGGSSTCLEIVLKGHDQLGRWLRPSHKDDNNRAKQVADLFQLCSPENVLLDKKNVDLFLGDGVLDIPAQVNDPSCHGELCNIAKVCSSMVYQYSTLNRTPVEILANVSLAQRHVQDSDQQCQEVDWNAYLDYVSTPTKSQEEGNRSWLWQTCTEFGYYQTCEGGDTSTCPFGKGFHPLEQDFDLCQAAFGINATTVRKNVESSIDCYGGKSFRPGTSRILSLNGNVDPWSYLGRRDDSTSDADPILPNYWVPGASHHFWTHPVRCTDTTEVQIARQVIYLKVKEWLEEPKELIGTEVNVA